tara:strand:- start:77557 stop:78456 length:900 start_codon:yes stop_codon:yes gene_type:complete
MIKYHNPVLFKEAIHGLKIQPKGIYVDVTYGGGGHSRGIIDLLSNEGRLFGFDQDADALENLIDDSRFEFISANFSHLKQYLKYYNVKSVDGILADLGVSSHQFDNGSRGFSIRNNGRLDMRMNQSQTLDAHEVLNKYSEDSLSQLFYSYGELRNSKKLAKLIINRRVKRVIQTTHDLIDLVEPLVPNRFGNKFLAKLFQAIRIEVNDELSVLKLFLEQATNILNPGGRLVCISYHSIEDRIVKRYFQSGNFEGKQQKDFYGNLIAPLNKVGKLKTPSKDEIATNSRSRSAKLRIAEKR